MICIFALTYCHLNSTILNNIKTKTLCVCLCVHMFVCLGRGWGVF